MEDIDISNYSLTGVIQYLADKFHEYPLLRSH